MAAGNWVDWNTGDLVTAASFQDIQDSIVFIYADETAANAALTNKVEGTVFYDTTNNLLKAWDGSQWISAESGDITAVNTASNSGLAGGATSGAVSLTLDPSNLSSGVTVDSANDLLILEDVTDGTVYKVTPDNLGIGGITEADHWRLTTEITNTTADITSGWERGDTSLMNYIGTGMSESSGIFSFPSTGIYLITFFSCCETTNSSTNLFNLIGTTDNFSTEFTLARTDNDNSNGSLVNFVSSAQVIVDITDISNQKVKFSTNQSGAGAKLLGSSTITRTGATFVRLGDT